MMDRRFETIMSGGLAALILSLGGAWAQVLTPWGYTNDCVLTNQEAIVVFQGGRQTLALEARFEVLPTEREGTLAAAPERLGWVVPIPAGGALAEPPFADVYSDLYRLSHPPAKRKYKLRTGRPTAINRFGDNIFGGSGFGTEETTLAWTVIEGSGETALAALKEWVAAQGLKGLSEELAADYAAEGWTFAVAVAENPGESGVLGPAAFVFPSEEVVLPLRFQADAGEFDLLLYIVSDKVLETRSLSGWRIRGVDGWEKMHREAWFQGYMELAKTEAPESFTAYVDLFRPAADDATAGSPLYFHVLGAERLNGYGRTTARQSTDFALPEKGKSSKRFSDRKSSDKERRNRQRRTRHRNFRRYSR